MYKNLNVDTLAWRAFYATHGEAGGLVALACHPPCATMDERLHQVTAR